MVKVITLLLLFIISPVSFALSQVTATIDKNPVAQDESIILQVTADDDIERDALDLSLLEKDFIVGNTSVSSQTSMINFKTTRQTTWTTVLMAKHTGKIIIPALNIKGKKTAPIALVVTKADDSSTARANKPLFTTAEVSNNEVYVQQLFTLTVKLYFSAQLKSGSLSEPEMAGATFETIGKDQESIDIINGKRFKIITRTYLVKPEKSGNFTLTTPFFSGEILDNSRVNSNFFSFANTKPINVPGKSINIKVKPIPSQVQGDWLPSELLTLNDEWQPTKNYKVGEPITRIITLSAVGLAEEQLPKLTFDLGDDINVYPDQAKTSVRLNQGVIYAQKVQSFAIVANKAGDLTIPPLTLHWWNTKLNKMQQAVIPAKTIHIAASRQTSNTASIVQPIAESPALPAANTPEKIKTIYIDKPNYLQWLFLALWLSTLVAWFISARQNRHQHIAVKKSAKTTTAYQQLQFYCKQNDGQKALAQILPWLSELTGENFHHLSQALHFIADEDLSTAVHELEQSYFAKSPKVWQGETLLSVVNRIQKQGNTDKKNALLALNPV